MGTQKRILLGAVVGTTVFGAVFGLAAGLDVSSVDKLGSGLAAITSCDLDGVTTSFVFDGATNVTAIQVDMISDECDDAVVSVAAFHDAEVNRNGPGSEMVSGSTQINTYTGDNIEADNSVVVMLDAPMNAALLDYVVVTLHGGHLTTNGAP